MERQIHTISEYQKISADIWAIFKKYFPAGVNTDTFTQDVDVLDKKYKKDVRQYCFMKNLLKVYFDELNELKGLRDGEFNKG